jgi:outer membrane protein assembly factor BamE
MRHRNAWLAVVLSCTAAAVLSACGYVPTIPGFTPYKMEIQQGNFIDQEMIARLKPGMTREQVRFILGTPLVSDLFHADRWDYVFSRRPVGGGATEQRRFAVFFEEGKLARIEGDVVPRKMPASASGS